MYKYDDNIVISMKVSKIVLFYRCEVDSSRENSLIDLCRDPPSM